MKTINSKKKLNNNGTTYDAILRAGLRVAKLHHVASSQRQYGTESGHDSWPRVAPINDIKQTDETGKIGQLIERKFISNSLD